LLYRSIQNLESLLLKGLSLYLLTLQNQVTNQSTKTNETDR
jgi:hypothetical protein